MIIILVSILFWVLVFLLYLMPWINDSADMRPLYFVPEKFSPLLSDTSVNASLGGAVYFSLSPFETEDIVLRFLCGRACVLLARGVVCEHIYKILEIEDISNFDHCFRVYNGMSMEEYRSWALAL